jgi:DNA recombination protein RmuC
LSSDPVVMLVLVLVAAGIGAVVALAVARRRGDQDAGLADQVREELAAQRRELESQREASLHEAIRSVVSLASDQLGQQSQLGVAHLDQRNAVVGQRLEAMDEQLDRLRLLVQSLDQQRAEGFGELAARLEQAGRATAELNRTTDALRQALAAPQTRGQWGERMAADVLRAAGFVEGVNFLRQSASVAGRPDFTFPLPGGRCVHMDVKFPLDNYLRHLEATAPDEQERTKRAFLHDVRNRITELARRDYIDPGSGTLDQVILFLPNEHLYGFVHQSDAQLLDVALRYKVVLCSPLTLFAVLAVIRQAVDDHVMEIKSAEILDLLGGFTTQWEKFTDQLERLGARLDSTQKAFDDVNGVRRRQLERQLDKIDDLRQHAVGDGGSVLELPARPADDQVAAG